MFKWKESAIFLVCIFANLVQLSAGSSNYSILLDYPFQVNQTAVKVMFDARLKEFIRTEPASACLALYNFNFNQLPDLPVYTPLDTLKQVSQDVMDNRTILIAGFSTHFGLMMVGSNLTNDTSDVTYKSTGFYGANQPRLNTFWFNENLYLDIINRMLLSFQQTSTAPTNEKAAIVIYRQQYVQINPFSLRIDMNRIVAGISMPFVVFYYNNDNSKIIASAISMISTVTNIVTILNGVDTSSFIQASLSQSLIRWNIRWIICSLEGTMDFSNSLINDRDTRNITLLTFGLPPNTTVNQIAINSSTDAFLYDMVTVVITYLRFAFCPSTFPKLPTNISGITGTTKFILNFGRIERLTYIVRTYRGLGSIMQYIGDIMLDGGYGINVSTIPAPPAQRTSIWQRSKAVKILFYKYEPDNLFKWNASSYTNFNDKIEGYMVDLLKQLLTRANLTYQFVEADPNTDTGTRDQATGIWNGIFGLVQNGTFDLSSSLLTWTPERAADFDTVRGVMYYSISLLMSNTQSTIGSNLFQFLNPLKWTVWLTILGITIGFSIVLTILNYVSPNKNSFSFYESFFFSVGSLLHGVTVDPPNRYSGRLMACAFWYFTFVVFALYIANYGAILTKEHLQPSVSSVAEILQALPVYTFGTYRPSLVFDTLWSSNNLNERLLAKIMAYNLQNATTNDYSLNIADKVKNSNYIFIDESAINDYRAYQYCLNSTGYFGSFEYVLYLSKQNDLTPILQYHLDAMIADNELDKLQSISWPTTPNPKCVSNDFVYLLNSYTKTLDSYVSASVISLRLDYMGGIFIITLGGCMLSIILAFFEWTFRATIQRLVLRTMRRQNRQFLNVE